MTASKTGIGAVKDAFENAQEVLPQPERDEHVTGPNSFKIYSAREILASERRVQWILYPYIEADATTLMSGERGTYKSFIALDWACRAAAGIPAIGYPMSVGPKRVLFISAEGKGLQQRLQGWLNGNRVVETSGDVEELLDKNLRFVEQPVNMGSGEALRKLKADLARLSFDPDFIVVDTLTRNSDGNIEESNSRAQQYLCQLDSEIRARYRCAILLIHHLGKDHGRGHRGPSSLANNTEAEMIVSRPHADVKSALVEFGRVKDSEPPKPFWLDAKTIETGKLDGFDQPITSLVMLQGRGSHSERLRPKLTGKNQQALLAALGVGYESNATTCYSSFQLRQLLKVADVDRQRHPEAIKALTKGGYLKEVSEDKYLFVPEDGPAAKFTTQEEPTRTGNES
jgi:hypothetical protein